MPDKAPDFTDEVYKKHFKELVDKLCKNKAKLKKMRADFFAIKKLLAKFIKDNMGQKYSKNCLGKLIKKSEPCDPEKLPHSGKFSEAEILKAICQQSEGEQKCDGNTVFDPWNGKWKGPWVSEGKGWSWEQDSHHVWTITKKRANGKYVQMVTQTKSNVKQNGKRTPKEDDCNEFIDGSNIDKKVKAGKVDLAINVYDKECGVTGWVTKNNKTVEMPHIGYKLGKDVLIWITQEQDKDGKPKEPGTYLIFFEWANPKLKKYGILGRRFKLKDGKIEMLDENHYGVYRNHLKPYQREEKKCGYLPHEEERQFFIG
jgi:hypothetical protein